MGLHLTVTAKQANIDRYHSLLTKEWTEHTLEGVLQLLWKEIGDSGHLKELPFRDVLKPNNGKSAQQAFRADIIDRIREFSGFFANSLIPAMPATSDFAGNKSQSLAQAETVWTYLILHTLVPLKGNTGFFLDTQSLLFLTTVYFLLPTLKEQEYTSEQDCLINALYMHTLTAWIEQPDHFFSLLGILMDYLGKDKHKEVYLRLSLRLTPVDDESYLSKVQDFLFTLLDAKKHQEAWSFLLQTYKNAPAEYLHELEEMMMLVHKHPSKAS